MSLTVPDFSALRVLVIGDLMLDQYWFGPTSRISPEAPVPVVRVTGGEARAGGAANVAVNLASLGAGTVLGGIVGEDAGGEQLQRLLAERGIEFHGVRSARHPTITKLRVLSRNQQLIRLDTENQYDSEDVEALAPVAEGLLDAAQACVLSD
ncbi:MAG: bifunctional heptose 7-phosphate kinase/heptose 1-phosphate adenyltransferase, partial [Gammaproteobacteria bacterium]